MLKACAWRNLYLSYDSFSLGAKFMGTVVGEACISRQENTALAGVLPDAGFYFVSCKFKISSYVEVCVPFKSSSLHQCSRPFWKLRQLLWGFCLLWVVNSVEWMMLWRWPWEELLWRQHSSRFHSHPPYLPDPLGLRRRSYSLLTPGFLLLSVVSSKLLLTLCFRKHLIPPFHF